MVSVSYTHLDVYTDRVMNFTIRFKERFQLENLGIRDVPNPRVPLLWACDTAWSLATAVSKYRVSSSPPGTTLLSAVLNTTFDGLAGRFRLVNGQLQLSTYEIINIICKGARIVGFWTPESGIFRNLKANDEKGLKQILWPGDIAIAPRGWDVSSTRRPLHITVPSRRGFNELVEVSFSPTTNTSIVTGYCIDVFDMLMKNLPYPVAYQYVPFTDKISNYDPLLDLVYEKKADAIVGDMTISMSRMNKVAFTMPFTDTGLSMIVVLKKDSSGSMWIFLQPMTSAPWITSFAFFFLTGFTVWAIEHRINPEFRGTPWQQFGITFYFAFSTLVFSHKEKLESNLSRFVVTVWVFVLLILTSSYTASLTSMLTVQRLQPTVTSVEDLLRNGDYVGYQSGSTVKYWLEEMGFHKEDLRGYATVQEYAEALQRGSGNEGVSAIVDEVPYLKIFLSKYCEGYTMVGPTYHGLGGFGFAFPIGSPMVHDVSQAIMTPAVQEEMVRIERKWFGDSEICESKINDINSSRLSFSNFGGLFLITCMTSGLALLISLSIFVYQERDKLRAEASRTRSVSLQRLRTWLEHLVCTEHRESGVPHHQEAGRQEYERDGHGSNQLQGDG
ncbi:Glutamate receptor 2.8 [Dichanthelium oligosanthes]|uniref:Glutamate receptor 2.8 n=1 Tax=Dichanthelium oligosanthes TaxID=888268 RepID=A0A1E5V0V2_9POAL|nr:Glutamate receptor 2.8 [Dichanthelium oligosanthes]